MESNNQPSNPDFSAGETLPDFEKVQQKALIKKTLILIVISVAIVLIGFMFGMDLTKFAKLLRFLR